MAYSVLKLSNRAGFPCIENIQVNLSTTSELFTFNSHPYVRNRFYGGLFIKISGTPSAPSTAVPINFTTSGELGTTVAVYDAQGVAFTTATWPGDGIYLGFYDSDEGKLRLVSYTIPSA